MAYVVPFRALRYNPERVSLASVVTQPYDKISPTMQERYYAASPHNLVRIILGNREVGDTEAENLYSRAAAYFRKWRQQGVLQQDELPSIYPYAQRFLAPNGRRTELERRGFIALGRIEDYSAGVVYRHEQTLAKPKADRLELLRATRAHFGQIFMLYSDRGEIDALLSPQADPVTEVTDEYGVIQRLWRITDTAVLESVCARMRDKKLIIADGHHRYETALSYRNECRAAARAAGRIGTAPVEPGVQPALEASDAPYDLLMMTFINMENKGLVILPTHRVVHGLGSFSVDRFRSSVRAYFNVEEVDSSVDAARAASILGQAGHVGPAFLAVTASSVLLLHTPKAPASLFQGVSLRQQSLDVVQLHKVLLGSVLGLSEESIRNQQNLSYVREAGEAMAAVRGGSANVAFLMNPCRMEQIRDIAFAGEVLPQKSTDFYPKLLSGLTIYALD